MESPLAADLKNILPSIEDDVRLLGGRRILFTGATGFVGKWLLEAILYAADELRLKLKIAIVGRNPGALRASAPHLASHGSLELIRSDVRELPASLGRVDAAIHAASPASAALVESDPREMFSIVVDGTQRILDELSRSGEIPVLFTSSGAVYGAQPADVPAIDETASFSPDTMVVRNVYHEAKRAAEMLCAVAASSSRIQPKIARLFAFVGPYLPINAHFAIGNFMRDALNERSVHIRGDGRTVRSYLYGSDMVVWLLRILVRGVSLRPYNVGSAHAVDLLQVAEIVADLSDGEHRDIIIGNENAGAPVDRYVPNVERARNELSLRETVPLRDAISRTLNYLRKIGSIV